MNGKIFNSVNPGEKDLVRKLASMPLPMGKGRSLVDVSREVGSQLGINPNMLASSSLVEGVNQLFTKGGSIRSAAYEDAAERGEVDKSKYPVDAFYYAGIDNFAPVAETLKQKGYLPKDVDYKLYSAWNEATERNIAKFDNKGNIVEYYMPKQVVDSAYFGEGPQRQQAQSQINNLLKAKGVSPVQTVAFTNTEDMIKTKGAYLRYLQDKTKEYASKVGVKPTDKEIDYLVMSAYNGGEGTMRKIVDKIKLGEKEIVKKGGPNVQAHKNVSKRIEYIEYLSDLFNSKNGPQYRGVIQKQTKP